MNELRCEAVQERLPDLVRGALIATEAAPLREHAEACADCRDTLALLELLEAGRPHAPEGLALRVEAAVTARPRGVARPWWGLAAAAVAALALGIGVTSGGDPLPEVPAFVADAGTGSVWPADDGLVAGAPALGDLSEEALMTLLDEMGAGPSGGAA